MKRPLFVDLLEEKDKRFKDIWEYIYKPDKSYKDVIEEYRKWMQDNNMTDDITNDRILGILAERIIKEEVSSGSVLWNEASLKERYSFIDFIEDKYKEIGLTRKEIEEIVKLKYEDIKKIPVYGKILVKLINEYYLDFIEAQEDIPELVGDEEEIEQENVQKMSERVRVRVKDLGEYCKKIKNMDIKQQEEIWNEAIKNVKEKYVSKWKRLLIDIFKFDYGEALCWLMAGFSEIPDVVEKLVKNRISPIEAGRWIDLGVGIADRILSFIEIEKETGFKFTKEIIDKWQKARIFSPYSMYEYEKANISPESVWLWIKAFKGIFATHEAIFRKLILVWNKYYDPEEAREWIINLFAKEPMSDIASQDAIFIANSYKKAGVSPKDAGIFYKAGISADKAKEYLKRGIPADLVVKFVDIGIEDKDEIMRWLDIEPQDALAFARMGINVEDAKEWLKLGVSIDEVSRWSLHFGDTALGWYKNKFSFEDAKRWFALDIFPEEAVKFQELNIMPRDVEKAIQAGIEAFDIVRFVDVGLSIDELVKLKNRGEDLDIIYDKIYRKEIDIKDIRELLKERVSRLKKNISEKILPRTVREEWLGYFKDEEKALDWFSYFKEPKEARRWYEAGFEPKEAYEWVQRGFKFEEAVEWRKYFEAKDAKEWVEYGFSLESAISWRRNGFTAFFANKWRLAGFDPEVAKKWSDKRLGPEEAAGWRNIGVSLTKAVDFKRKGISSREYEMGIGIRSKEEGKLEDYKKEIYDLIYRFKSVISKFADRLERMWGDMDNVDSDFRKILNILIERDRRGEEITVDDLEEILATIESFDNEWLNTKSKLGDAYGIWGAYYSKVREVLSKVSPPATARERTPFLAPSAKEPVESLEGKSFFALKSDMDRAVMDIDKLFETIISVVRGESMKGLLKKDVEEINEDDVFAFGTIVSTIANNIGIIYSVLHGYRRRVIEVSKRIMARI